MTAIKTVISSTPLPLVRTVVSEQGSLSTVILTGIQGPPGAPGQTEITYTTPSPMSGHRIVMLDADGELAYASASNLAHAARVVGMTTNAAGAGGDVLVQSRDEITEPSWNWDVSKLVYLGENGLPTQIEPIAPASAFSLIVGFPVTPTKLFLKLGAPIHLNA